MNDPRLDALNAWLVALPRFAGWSDLSVILLAPVEAQSNPLRQYGFVGASGINPDGSRLGALFRVRGATLPTDEQIKQVIDAPWATISPSWAFDCPDLEAASC